jgi:haloalkane dehalogenase
MASAAAEGWRAAYPFQSHFLDAHGHAMHYVDEGAGPPLLCVHGNPTWSFYWRRIVTQMRASHRVIAPDHIGCGLSDKPADWSYRLSDHIANLEHLVLSLDLRDITLAVHDWGGAIGFGVAVRHPERFRRFIVFNTAAFRSTRIPLRIAACRIPGLGPVAVRGLNGFALAATVMATERGLAPEAREGLLAPYDNWAHRVAVLRFVQDIPMHAGHPSWATLAEVEAGLARLTDKPMLIAWGERDWCFTPAFREEWERRFPAASVHRIADAGHYVVEDAGEQVGRLVADFCRA